MKRNYFIVGLIFLIFFVISLLTNILGPLIPDIIEGFSLNLFLAGFLPFSFFVAYGVMSIPAGTMVEKMGEKKVMSMAFGMSFIGSMLFALFPTFPVAMLSLFLIGLGMAVLQVAINPLLRTAGGEEHFAFNSVMAQLVFGLASYLSPQLYSYLVTNLQDPSAVSSNFIIGFLSKVVPQNLSWVSLYWSFIPITLIMVVVILAVKFPKVELQEDEKTEAIETYQKLFKNKTVILYFIGIFAYVGSEQGVANWISKFLTDYHGFDPKGVGADAVSYFWGLLTLGCLLGLFLLKVMDSKKVLLIFTAAAMVTLTLALFGTKEISRYAFPLVGFFASVMWSVIFSLALNSLKSHHGAFSGILCTGIIGGAIVPLIIGKLGDMIGLRYGMMFLYLTFGYILSIGIWAKPLIKNKTIND